MNNLEAIELQLSEIEVLRSIYPNELIVNNVSDFMAMKHFVQSDCKAFCGTGTRKLNISFTLNLQSSESTLKVEVYLPKDYPLNSLPEVFLRCDSMTRNMQQQCNEDFQVFLSTIELGETCLYQVLQWATDNAKRYISCSSTIADENVEALEFHESQSCVLARFWIYSHHIYNKEKRKSILEWAKELELTGFSMPGKPGIVCVEGKQQHCEEYWERVKRLSWKHVDVRHRENLEKSELKFKSMSEISFEVHGRRSNHMDMGEFYTYLLNHECEKVFKYLFGMEGKAKKGNA